MQVELPGIVLVGTAHVSAESVREVREVIAREKPAVVAVELDEGRLQAITDRKRFEETPITDLLTSGRSFFILAQTLLASFQRRMGEREGVEPGAEMIAAIHSAEEHGATVALADRDIGITLRRAWARMGFREKMRLSWEMFKSILGNDEDVELHVDEMLEEDVLTTMMADLSVMAPSISEVLIKERDAYLAANILEASKKGKVVAILGAGHLKGVQAHLNAPADIPPKKTFESIPEKKFPLAKIIGWGVPLLVLGILGYQLMVGIQQGDLSLFRDLALTWIVINGVLSAIGALIARAHPISVLTAFLAAPLTSLNPTLAAGWFAGIAEAKIRTPTVGDFQGISKLQTLKEFWGNRLARVLVVTAMTNLGSMAGTYIAGFLVATGQPLSFGFLGF